MLNDKLVPSKNNLPMALMKNDKLLTMLIQRRSTYFVSVERKFQGRIKERIDRFLSENR